MKRNSETKRLIRPAWALGLALLGLLARAPSAHAADAASLQFTVPAPDPVQAGEVLVIQALAVNTGDSNWTPGSYYWVAEIYDLSYKLVARTDQVSPQETVAAGAVAAITLPFPVPETAFGRRLYRVFLVKDNKSLLESDYKPFQIIEKNIPPPPPVVDYRLEGNVTLSYKNASRERWRNHQGATTVNAVGKIKDSSYLLNAYILHEKGEVFDPFIFLLTYYAPWGTIYGGDVVPSWSPLSVNGRGMRGAMLEQTRGRFDWSILGGQTVTSQVGTATTNGRYARSLYGARGAVRVFEKVKFSANYFLSADETGSLSPDPRNARFRGPTLVAQKNSGYGASLSWEPIARTVFLGDYQINEFKPDASKAGLRAAAWRGEFRTERKLFSFRSYVQRAAPNFTAFGAPSVVGDRFTVDGGLNLYPARWYSLSLTANQFRDNLANDPRKVTTTQQLASVGNSIQFPSGTGLTLSGSVNTAKGKPQNTLDNQTTTLGAGVSQALGRHSVSLNVQSSSFKDKNRLAHDLDTQTGSFSSSMRLPWNWGASFGVSQSDTKDKIDGSKRTSQSVSPSLAIPFSPTVSGQFWGTMTKIKSDSPTFPSDITSTTVNSEFTWNWSKVSNWTFGVGHNENKDKYNPSQDVDEITVSTRFSYSF